jgi:hypothetical protein
LKLFEEIGHMPYQDLDTLVFSLSQGERIFRPNQTSYALTKGISGQEYKYQPWELALFKDGVVTRLKHSLKLSNPACIFCNPVMSGTQVSFIYGRRLYSAEIINDTITRVQELAKGVFTGFYHDGRLATGIPPCTADQAQLVLDGRSYRTEFSELVRVIPHADGAILTGSTEGQFYSVYAERAGVAPVVKCYRIKANGVDVYKCCLVGETTVIYAVRNPDGTRYLYSDPAELDFIGTNFLTEVT